MFVILPVDSTVLTWSALFGCPQQGVFFAPHCFQWCLFFRHTFPSWAFCLFHIPLHDTSSNVSSEACDFLSPMHKKKHTHTVCCLALGMQQLLIVGCSAIRFWTNKYIYWRAKWRWEVWQWWRGEENTEDLDLMKSGLLLSSTWALNMMNWRCNDFTLKWQQQYAVSKQTA